MLPWGDFFSALHKVMGDHASRGPTPAGASLPLGLFMMFIPTTHFAGHSRDAATGDFVTY